jgi:CRP-like cAMP-binding protein
VSDQTHVGANNARTIRRLTLTSLLLTLVAMLLGLLFLLRTSGGTLFLFSTIAPLLVLAAITIVVGVAIYEYHQSHKLFVIERYPAERIIFRQGEEGDCAYFIREGQVEVVDEESGQVLVTLQAGDYFGEMALIANAPRSATIRTVSSVEVAVLGKQNFLNMMKLLPTTEGAILNTVRTRVMRDDERRALEPDRS